jgi:hypothetical protein
MENEGSVGQNITTKDELKTSSFEPKILGLLCNSAFFFEAKFFSGLGSQRKTWGKKKLALTCSNFAFDWRCVNV